MKRQIKILYIGNKLAKNGGTPTSIDILGPLLESEGYYLKYASSHSNIFLRMGDMLLRVVRYRKYNYVLVDTYSTLAFYFAWATSRLSHIVNLRYIPILHGGNLPERLEKSPRLCRQIFLNSKVNVVVSPYLKNHLERLNYDNILIPNSIDIRLYPFTERNTFEPRLLWVRAFHETYNPQLAVLVMAMLCKKYPHTTLTMVGPEKDGSMRKCKLMAEELGVQDRIIFTGKLEKAQWTELSKSHDIFINTTRFDNLPVSLIEAMALGLPVVSTNVGGLPFFITDQQDGLLVKDNDVEGMCVAIDNLVSDNLNAKNIARNARHKAEEFDWQKVKHQWLHLFSIAAVP